MSLLLDTHAFLWFVWDDANLSATAKSLVVDPKRQKFISAATYWEIAIKVCIGKLDLGEPFGPFMRREIARNNFTILAISVDHAEVVAALPQHHKDPFDRMLIAQGIIEKMPIVSIDAVFDAYPVIRLW
jgi:PIN domain nuclease of toxin-antitoxin system